MYLNPSKAGECLTMAYGIQKGKYQSEVFIEPNAAGKQAMLKAQYDKHLKSERNEIVSIQNPLTNATPTPTGMSDNGRRTMDFLEAGAIIAAAEDLGEGYKHWARFCYNPDHDDEWKLSGLWVINRLGLSWAFSNRRKIRNKQPEFFFDMAQLCAMDKAHREATGQAKFSDPVICRHLGYKDAHTANWKRSLLPHWELMQMILDRVNSKVMASVGKCVKAMQEEDNEKLVCASV